ncbi:hypothetical protein ACIGZJ_25820 [Kitasatospora sp. NPDC052868]|uniref:hypothetical protein n=1 Tax=Kitasatospora sp. NPDC052868 TaxID=3364060 RepID=UPI0037C536C6
MIEAAEVGRGASSESDQFLRQRRSIACLVWHSGSRIWVLTLAEASGTIDPGRLGPLTARIGPRLPQ